METSNSQIVIYKDQNGKIKIDVRFDGNTVWLTQDFIATLYNKGRSTITEHIQNILQEGELESDSVCREFRRTGSDGKEYLVKYYNLDLIIAVGYIDYDPTNDQSILFFKTVQNKVHYAVTGNTAAEIVVDRIDSGKQNLGLTNWRGAKPTKEELAQLNALVEQYLIFATEQARRRIPMTMNDWIEKLHGFLIINDRNILQDAGKISHELMVEIAEKKFDEYKIVEAKQDTDFDEVALNAIKTVKCRNKIKLI